MSKVSLAPPTIQARTVIIGAGLAGISTALNLLKNNYEDILIFEALDRVGGRCHTIEYEDSFLELGAQYIHGQVDNPIYYVSRDNKQIDEKYNEIMFVEEGDRNEDNNGICIEKSENSDDETTDTKYIFTTQHGEQISLNKGYELYNIVNRLIRVAKDHYLDINNNSTLDKDQSVGEFIYERLNEILESGNKPEFAQSLSDTEFRRLAEGFLVWRCKCENIEIGCSSVCDLSMKNYCLFKDLKGCQIMEPKFGYKSIIDCMLKPYETEINERLHLSTPLKKILICEFLEPEFNGNCTHCLYTNEINKIVLLFNDDSTANGDECKVVICDNVVCTMSLGFLKENLGSLIEPAHLVFMEKSSAVSRIGYGTVNKIFLEYDKPFWPENLEGMHNIWTKEDDNEQLLDKTRNLTDDNWFENISYFETVNNHDNLLSAWIGGCEFFEKYDDDKIASDCTMILRKRFNNKDIPMPKSIKRSTWWSNPFFKGSYSYMPLGADPADLQNLAAPIMINTKPVVMFAGEATHATQFSTGHAAVNTGTRESNRILEAYGKNVSKM